jgi:N-acetylneuraminic acid mutarotase
MKRFSLKDKPLEHDPLLRFDAAWQDLPPLKTPRGRCGMAMWGSDKIIVVGGTDKQDNILWSVEMYDIFSCEWADLPSLRQPKTGCAAIVVHDKLYVLGGFDASSCLSDCEVLDLSQPGSHFTLLPNGLPQALSKAVAVSKGHWIYVIGGFDRNTVYTFDTQTNQWNDKLPPMSVTRRLPAVAILDDKLVVAGGCNSEDDKLCYLESVETLDLKTSKWTNTIKSMPSQRAGAMAFVEQGSSNLIIAGGLVDANRPARAHLRYDGKSWSAYGKFPPNSNDDHLYNVSMVIADSRKCLYLVDEERSFKALSFTTNGPSLQFSTSWRGLYSPRQLRQRCGMAMWGSDKILVVGGRDEQLNDLRNVELYNIFSREWADLPPLRQPKRDCAAIVVNDKLYVFGGYSRWCLSDCEVLDLSQPDSQFTHLPNALPQALSNTVVVSKGDWIYVIGGFNGSSSVNTVYALDTRTRQWNGKLPPMNATRRLPAAVIFNDTLLVVAGGNREWGQIRHRKSVETLNLATGIWTNTIKSMPSPRGAAMAFVEQGSSNLIIAGGEYNDGKPARAYLRYDGSSWSECGNFPAMTDHHGSMVMAAFRKCLYYVDGERNFKGISFTTNVALTAAKEPEQTRRAAGGHTKEEDERNREVQRLEEEEQKQKAEQGSKEDERNREVQRLEKAKQTQKTESESKKEEEEKNRNRQQEEETRRAKEKKAKREADVLERRRQEEEE